MFSIFLTLIWFCLFVTSLWLLFKIKRSIHIVCFTIISCSAMIYFSFVVAIDAIIFQLIIITIMLAFIVKALFIEKDILVYLGIAPFLLCMLTMFMLSDFSLAYNKLQVFSDKSLRSNNELIQQAIFSKLNNQEKDFLIKTYEGKEKILATQSLGGARCLININSFACDSWIAAFVSWIKFKSKYGIGYSFSSEAQEKEREIFKEKYQLN